jgi:hypothetical protein
MTITFKTAQDLCSFIEKKYKEICSFEELYGKHGSCLRFNCRLEGTLYHATFFCKNEDTEFLNITDEDRFVFCKRTENLPELKTGDINLLFDKIVKCSVFRFLYVGYVPTQDRFSGYEIPIDYKPE